MRPVTPPTPPFAAELLAGPLSTAQLLSTPMLDLAPLPIMRAKALRLYLRAHPELRGQPHVEAAQAWLEARAVPAYRKLKRAPAAWAQYMADYDVTFKTLGESEAEALPQPNKPGFKLREAAAAPSTYLHRLIDVATRELHAVGHLSMKSGNAREHARALREENKDTLRARAQLDALKLRVIDGDVGDLPPGGEAAIVAVLDWPERVVLDMQTCKRLGRAVPRAHGHTLGAVLLPLRPRP